MRLRKLHVQGFAQLQNVEVDFRGDAPNLIIGVNEAGKSHLMQALYGILFGLEKADCERYLPWAGEQTMLGALDFVDDSGQLIRLERHFDSNQVTVIEGAKSPWTVKAGPKDHVAAAQRYFQCLERWLGFRDTKIFEATTFVQQSEVVQASLGGIAQDVKSLITGSSEADYEHVIKDLEKRLDGLRKKTPRMKARDLENKQEELARLEADYQEASRQHDQIAELKHQQEQLDASITAATSLRQQKERQLERIGDLVKRENEVSAIEHRFGELQTRLDGFKAQREALRAAEEDRDALATAALMDKVALSALDNNVKNALASVYGLEQRGAIANADAVWIAALDEPVSQAQEVVDALDSRAELKGISTTSFERLDRDSERAREQVRQLRERGATDEMDPEQLYGLNRAVEDARARLDAARQPAPDAKASGNLPLAGVAALLTVAAIVLTIAATPAALVLLVPAIGMLIYSFRGRQGNAAATATSIEQVRAAVEQAERERDAALTRFGVTTVEEAIALRDCFLQAITEERKMKRELDAALSEVGVGSVEEAVQLLREHDAASGALAQARQERDAALRKLGVGTVEDALELQRQYEAARAVALAAQKNRDDVLQQLNVKTIGEAIEFRDRYDRADGKVREAQSALRALGDQTAVEAAWAEARDNCVLARAAVDLLLKDNVALQLQDPEARAAEAKDLEESIEQTSLKLRGLEDDKRAVDHDLYVQGGSEQDVASLALQIEAVHAEIARIELQIRALTEAIFAFRGSAQEFYDNCLEPVTDATSRLLETITHGRYTAVRLSDDALEPSVDASTRSGIGVSDLSRGVCDQLYFSLRVALGEALAGGKVLPLVLDDPFVNFDPERLERTRAALKLLAQHTQVILFTCDPRYADWIEPILELQRVDPVSPTVQAVGAA